MSETHSLLAHLVPKLTPQVEDAATDALAFILNRSESCRSALVDLVGDDQFQLASLSSAKTQVVPSPTARLDLVGYDYDGAVALIIESKFWAPLLDGQASGYIDYLTAPGPSLLLFVAPEVRHAALWSKIEAQFTHDKPDARLTPVECGPQMRAAEVSHPADRTKRTRVALLSWAAVLDSLEGVDASTAPDVRQLKGLARTQDDIAFSPLHAEDFSATIPRRILDFNRVVDDVVDAYGVPQGWMTTKGLRAAPQTDGYLRYFRFRASAGSLLSSDIALYVSCNQWVKSAGTPLWLRIWSSKEREIDAIRSAGVEIEHDWSPGAHLWIPLRLLTGVEYADVLEDVVAQVERVRDVILPALRQAKADGLAAEDADSSEDAGIADSAAE